MRQANEGHQLCLTTRLPPVHPNTHRNYTDSSQLCDGRTGAAIHHEDIDTVHTVKVQGRQSVLRAELTEIAAAALVTPPTNPLRVFTDSLASLQLLYKWERTLWTLENKHMDLLDTLGQAIHASEVHTWFFKVMAHTGIEGNERANRGAYLAVAAGSEEGIVKVGYKPQTHVWRLEMCIRDSDEKPRRVLRPDTDLRTLAIAMMRKQLQNQDLRHVDP